MELLIIHCSQSPITSSLMCPNILLSVQLSKCVCKVNGESKDKLIHKT
jgi:hypothetical protein